MLLFCYGTYATHTLPTLPPRSCCTCILFTVLVPCGSHRIGSAAAHCALYIPGLTTASSLPDYAMVCAYAYHRRLPHCVCRRSGTYCCCRGTPYTPGSAFIAHAPATAALLHHTAATTCTTLLPHFSIPPAAALPAAACLLWHACGWIIFCDLHALLATPPARTRFSRMPPGSRTFACVPGTCCHTAAPPPACLCAPALPRALTLYVIPYCSYRTYYAAFSCLPAMPPLPRLLVGFCLLRYLRAHTCADHALPPARITLRLGCARAHYHHGFLLPRFTRLRLLPATWFHARFLRSPAPGFSAYHRACRLPFGYVAYFLLPRCRS